MAVRLLVPCLGFKAGDILDRGEASDAKWIASGKAEKVIQPQAVERATIRPKEKRTHGNAQE